MYVLDFPCYGQQVRANGFWAVLSHLGPHGIREVLYQELVYEVAAVESIWHDVVVELTDKTAPGEPSGARAGEPAALRVWIDGGPLQPLEHGALQKNGKRLDLSPLLQPAFVGIGSTGMMPGKSRFRNMTVEGPHVTPPLELWRPTLPQRVWANLGGVKGEHHADWWNHTTGNVDSTTDVTIADYPVIDPKTGDLMVLGASE
jgi:hypothetical protein